MLEWLAEHPDVANEHVIISTQLIASASVKRYFLITTTTLDKSIAKHTIGLIKANNTAKWSLSHHLVQMQARPLKLQWQLECPTGKQ